MNLKIFRLRSGEELICQVIEETKTKIKIVDPFIFKSSTMADQHGSYDMTIIRDWLAQTNNKTVSIPKNHIVLEYEPKEDTIKLYKLQLESEKSLQEKIVSLDDEVSSIDVPQQEQILTDFLNSIMADMVNMDPFMNDQTPKFSAPQKRKKRKNRELPSPEMHPDELNKHGIYINMMIPAESIMNLITAGILNPEDLLTMIKEVKKKNRFTGDEKTRGDFGNKFSDWNPDPDSGEYK